MDFNLMDLNLKLANNEEMPWGVGINFSTWKITEVSPNKQFYNLGVEVGTYIKYVNDEYVWNDPIRFKELLMAGDACLMTICKSVEVPDIMYGTHQLKEKDKYTREKTRQSLKRRDRTIEMRSKEVKESVPYKPPFEVDLSKLNINIVQKPIESALTPLLSKSIFVDREAHLQTLETVLREENYFFSLIDSALKFKAASHPDILEVLLSNGITDISSFLASSDSDAISFLEKLIMKGEPGKISSVLLFLLHGVPESKSFFYRLHPILCNNMISDRNYMIQPARAMLQYVDDIRMALSEFEFNDILVHEIIEFLFAEDNIIDYYNIIDDWFAK